MNDGPKWATLALLKLLDSVHGGELHDEFAAISSLLGLELPVPPDPAPDDAAQSQQDRIYEFLAGQTEPASLSRIVDALQIKRWTVVGSLGRLQRQDRIEHTARDAWRARGPAPDGSEGAG
jgi:hypothetical protein